MKQEIFFSFIISLILLSGCASKTIEDKNDEYYSAEINIEKLQDTDNEYNSQKDNNKSDLIKQTNENNSFIEFMTYKHDEFIETENINFYTAKTVAGIEKTEAVFVLNTDDGTAGFGSKYLTGYNYLFMNKNARTLLINAGTKYFSEFERKSLIRKGKRTLDIYGNIESTVYWGTAKIQAKNIAHPKMYIGYKFIKDSPYFSITCYSAENERKGNYQDEYPRESMIVQYYFTKAQLKAIMDLLSENNIQNSLINTFIPTEIEGDEY